VLEEDESHVGDTVLQGLEHIRRRGIAEIGRWAEWNRRMRDLSAPDHAAHLARIVPIDPDDEARSSRTTDRLAHPVRDPHPHRLQDRP
jgi:hypothetical protein